MCSANVVEFRSPKESRSCAIMDFAEGVIAAKQLDPDTADELRVALRRWVERANVDFRIVAQVQLPADDMYAQEITRKTTEANAAALGKQVRARLGTWLVDVFWIEVELAIARRELREARSLGFSVRKMSRRRDRTPSPTNLDGDDAA